MMRHVDKSQCGIRTRVSRLWAIGIGSAVKLGRMSGEEFGQMSTWPWVDIVLEILVIVGAVMILIMRFAFR